MTQFMGRQLGAFIKSARQQAGLSQADLAQKLRLKSAQSISNIERGLVPLPRNMVSKIARYIDVDGKELVDRLVDEIRQTYLSVLPPRRIKQRRKTS